MTQNADSQVAIDLASDIASENEVSNSKSEQLPKQDDAPSVVVNLASAIIPENKIDGSEELPVRERDGLNKHMVNVFFGQLNTNATLLVKKPNLFFVSLGSFSFLTMHYQEGEKNVDKIISTVQIIALLAFLGGGLIAAVLILEPIISASKLKELAILSILIAIVIGFATLKNRRNG